MDPIHSYLRNNAGLYPAEYSSFDIEVDIDNMPCPLLGEEGPNPDNIASEVKEEQEEIDSDGDDAESDNDESLFEQWS